ncbi:type VI secretion system tube protein Hcp [Defluviimonas sp. WL0024]|uniref:Type VI secretion system tube protein Hcp n=1 Tax=Albidovulum salinarum TaxID=2984153 RepID=A0ABT2X826_9RHOB|nr:type VI secretion system tube protein Hcp [Defluviimonas sp. WL0024]MCU9849889.1 type VI secretion system tube protein Hcp [Defluviimonas sp. WL0024]
MENVFIKIDGIPGEAREKNHKDWIPVKTIGWGVERTLDMTDLGTTQRGYANANFQKITLNTELSKASAKICTYVASGKSIKELTIEMCRSGDDASIGMEPYLIIKLRNAIIDSYTVSGGEDTIPAEDWSLAYRGIEYSYKPADFATGKLGSPEVFKWNLETGDVS